MGEWIPFLSVVALVFEIWILGDPGFHWDEDGMKLHGMALSLYYYKDQKKSCTTCDGKGLSS